MKIKGEFGTIPRLILLVVLITALFADTMFFKENVSINTRLTSILFWLICVGICVLQGGKSYEIKENGLVVLWFGVVPRTYPWDYFSEVAVYELYAQGPCPYIVCSKSGWSKKRKAVQWFLFHPFSAFPLKYTPERFQLVKEYCDRACYVTDRARADKLYEERNKK